MCFNPGPERRVPIPNRYIADAKFCFCKNNKRIIIIQHGLTEIWEDNASCILMSENPTNRERSRYVDVRVHFLRDMVRDGSVKLIKYAGKLKLKVFTSICGP
jgi:hypothetical protein